MQGLPRIHYRPRESATYEAPLDILIPALMKLRTCNDSLKALVLVDSLHLTNPTIFRCIIPKTNVRTRLVLGRDCATFDSHRNVLASRGTAV